MGGIPRRSGAILDHQTLRGMGGDWICRDTPTIQIKNGALGVKGKTGILETGGRM